MFRRMQALARIEVYTAVQSSTATSLHKLWASVPKITRVVQQTSLSNGGATHPFFCSLQLQSSNRKHQRQPLRFGDWVMASALGNGECLDGRIQQEG